MAKALAIPGLSEDDAYAAVAARVVAVRADELFEHSAGVLDLGDIERLHDMRVASRRLRAALEVFEPCFPRKRFRRVLGEVKELADALGERRDRDVGVASLGSFAGAVTGAEAPGVRGLIERLRAEQHAANEALEPRVAGPALSELRARITELTAAAAARAPTPDSAQAARGNGAGPAVLA